MTMYEPSDGDIIINEDLFLYGGLVPVYKGAVILDLDADFDLTEQPWTTEEGQQALAEHVAKTYGDASTDVEPVSPTMETMSKHDGEEEHEDGDPEFGDKVQKAAEGYRSARKALFGEEEA